MIEFYAVLIGIIRNTLEANGVNPALCSAISRDIINKVATNYGGQTVYLKSLYAEQITARNRQIAEDYNGANLAELSRKYRKSHAWLRKIIVQFENETTE